MKSTSLLRVSRSSRGMALVIVLSCVVLISMLVVSFLALVRTDQQASGAFAISAEARLLGDIPINMAIGQIRRGSEQLGYRQTWASQPGMIRTYGVENDGSGVRAKATGLFKLYSDDQMVVTNTNATYNSGGLSREAAGDAIQQDINDLATWNTRPGMFTDINEPAPYRDPVTNAVNLSFPVVDPRALTPGADALPIEGFDFSESAVPQTLKPVSATDTNTRLPMPVKWIYILKDGRFTVPTSADATTASFSGVNAPTDDNPIVGRIAFWTDDESCKVNVNTASEGTPWYPPVTTNDTDREFARRLPAHFEYSRHPGHPAQVSLSPIFQVFSSDLAVPGDLSDSELKSRLQFYHDINPRLIWGGTMGGTQVAQINEDIPAKNDRLYTSLDELLLTTDRQLQSASLTSERLALARFFLSTYARAPEMTLFNKFRFSLWPNWREAAQRTELDNFLELINSSGVRGGGSSYGNVGAFDRGLGWSFFRHAPFKSTSNRGSSQTQNSDFTNGGSCNVTRLLTGVLGQMTGTPVAGSVPTLIPGFGNQSYIGKYTKAKRDQILVSMIDALRIGVDAYRPVNGAKHSYSPPQNSNNNPNRLGEYSVVPLYADYTGVVAKGRGFGRFPTVTELAIVFMATEADESTGVASKMQAFLVLEPFSPTSGPPAWSANLRYRISGLSNLSVTVGGNVTGLFPGRDSLLSKVNLNPSLMAGGNKSPYTGLLAQFAQPDKNQFMPRNPASPLASLKFPFISDPIELDSVTEFIFSGGNLKVEILEGWTNSENEDAVLQTLNMPLAGTNASPPFRTPGNLRLKAPQIRGSDGVSYNSLGKRLAALYNASQDSWHPEVLIRNGDIVRATQASSAPLSPAKGDLRFFTSLHEVPANYFAPVGAAAYINFDSERLHDLRDGAWTPNQSTFNASTGSPAGNLVLQLNAAPEVLPAVPQGLTSARNKNNKPGDWDNGMGEIEDGPYVNRADNGSRWFGPDGGYYDRGKDSTGPDSHFQHSFSTHRNIASAVAFGSIPTGIDPTNPANTEPWQTLLFCPNPPSRSTNALNEPTASDHKGFAAPRDHLMLDFFWMPTTQPYAISEALSSAGKINMNYRMLPFSHIERSTGLHAAMKATRVTAISRDSVINSPAINHYKSPNGHPYETRYLVNVPETLTGFNNRFDNQHDIFRSASEICEIFLVPEEIPGANYAPDVPAIPAYADMNRWWNGNNPSATSTHVLDVTGDNTREAPYNDLYPKLTARSNTFTVHYRVQTLTKARSSAANEWVEDKDIVTGEHRGSAALERYLDPNNYQVASINQGGGRFADSWDGFFRFRIISRKDFSP